MEKEDMNKNLAMKFKFISGTAI